MGALPNYIQQSWPTERQLTRYKLTVPVRIVTSGGKVTEGTCLDVSEGGLGAKVPAPLELAEEAVLEFQCPEHDELFRIRAIVRHFDLERCGFEFLTVTPEQREIILFYGQSLSTKKRLKFTR